MSQWDKLLERIRSLSGDVRFEEARKVLESLGYTMKAPRSGSSHCTFRKKGKPPITIPHKAVLKKIYVKLLKQITEEETGNEGS